MRLALITCDVLRDEFAALTPSRPHVQHVHILQQGLHNTPDLLRSTLQAAITTIETQLPHITTIALGYGLCSRGTEGVATARATLIIPRAHDCITLLLGSKERYAQYVAAHPGTYWYSPGWNRCHLPPGPDRHAKLRQKYVEKFGEEDADFLMETEQAWFKAYDRATYVDTGLTDPAAVAADLAHTQACAQWLGWSCDRQQGSPNLLTQLLDGPWPDSDFLTLPPNTTAKMTADHTIITAVGLPQPKAPTP